MPLAPRPVLHLPPPAAPAGPGSASFAYCRRGRCCGGAGGSAVISTSGTRHRGEVAAAGGGSRCRWTPPGPSPPPTSPGPSGPSRSSCSRRCPPNPPRHAQWAGLSSACAWDWLARRAKTRAPGAASPPSTTRLRGPWTW